MDVIKEADNTNDGYDATFVKVLVTHGYTICVQAYPNLFLTYCLTLRHLFAALTATFKDKNLTYQTLN